MQGPDETFVRNLTGCQNRLYAYVLSLVSDPDAAREVTQDANVSIWKNYGNFTPGTDFGAWACKMAYFAVLAHRRQRSRERLLFDDDVVESLASAAAARLEKSDTPLAALDECLERLPEEYRTLVAQRYGHNESVGQLAAKLGRSAGSVATLLYRIRQSLLDCLRGKLASGDLA